MKIYREMSLREFNPWSGAVDLYNRIDGAGKLDDLETILEDLYPEGMGETDLNDLLWFDKEAVCEWLDMETQEEIEQEEEEAREEEEALEAARDAVIGYSLPEEICDAYGGECDRCPLAYWEPDCYDQFRILKRKEAKGA